jgi:DNA mismatch repair endonuclease MutH
MAPSKGFDYRTASESAILDLAAELPGLNLGDIPGSTFKTSDPRRGRGDAGKAVEAFFGIPPNSRPGADFPGAGIELKSVPLIQKSVGLRVDQRTVIAQINYGLIATEDWETASVRRKLRILFVFFERLRDLPKASWPIVHVALWHPDPSVEEGVRRDWERVRDKVASGLAHELSEADGRILGPCTKSDDGVRRQTQPFNAQNARPRAWALKPPFVLGIYEQSKLADPDYGLVVELSELDHLLSVLNSRRGDLIDDLSKEMNRPRSNAKDYAARVVHEYAASVEPRSASASATFPIIRAPRTTSAGRPYEAVSFPAFRHLELAEETWENSLLLSYLEHLLFVPVIGAARSTPQWDCSLGPPLYWRPSAEQLAGVEAEWSRFRDLVKDGHASSLPGESETRFIHVRPHGKDKTDRDQLPGGGDEIKKSFWLNKQFVAEILAEAFPEA